MRIISGNHKGRSIRAPKNLPVRPTTDMAKEALFNILNNRFYFAEVTVLDLFSGTGNISYEFASRGVSRTISVDSNSGCTQFIEKTSNLLDLAIKVVQNDVFKYLEETEDTVNIIFADPPYDMALADFENIPALVFTNQLLLEDGLLIIEHSKHMKLSHVPHFSHERKYGNSVFSFFEKA